MNKNINKNKMKYTKYLLALATLIFCFDLSAQETKATKTKHKNAWEIGLGGTGFHLPRVGLKSVSKVEQGYIIDLGKRDLLFGADLYVARELGRHFALDLQTSVAYSKDPVRTHTENRYLGMASLGLQWRLGEYFNSKYIDPYFRIGGGYMYKNFRVNYEDVIDATNLTHTNVYNKEGKDYNHLLPVSAGAGVKMWLNDRFGIGMQADYVYLPYENVANTIQGTVNLIWRIGGETKKPQPKEIIVEKVVNRDVVREVEKVVEKVVYKEKSDWKEISELFTGINFEFDSSRFTVDAVENLNSIANLLKKLNPNTKILVVGCTDAVGNSKYNTELSEKRAKAVVEALILRGVPKENLKWRGIGSKLAYFPAGESNELRRNDRKIFVEIVHDSDYWNAIK